jgi:CBS domain-containing protein
VPVPVRPLREIAVLSQFKVKDVMTKNVKTVSPDFTVNQFLDFMAKHHHTGYPVLNEHKDLIGMVTLEDAANVEKGERDTVLVRDIARRNIVVVYAEELALDAFKKMGLHDIARIAVVDEANSKKLIGILTKTDLTHILRDKL